MHKCNQMVAQAFQPVQDYQHSLESLRHRVEEQILLIWFPSCAWEPPWMQSSALQKKSLG
jgi:hypothetical protein